MTYVEFYDRTSIENICTCLTKAPDRVVLIGSSIKQINMRIKNYSALFDGRGIKIEFIPKTISRYNLKNAVALLTEIIEKYDDCVFDITGGEEILNVALGIVYEKYPQKKIQIQKCNVRNNHIYDCDEDGNYVCLDVPNLSIEENIRAYGGEIIYGGINEEKTYRWDMNPDFLKDIETIWDICKKDVRYWNTQIGVFEAVDKVGKVSNDGLTTVTSRGPLEFYLKKHNAKYAESARIIGMLLEAGLLTQFDADESNITISYKNEQVKKCLTVSGQALEMKIYTIVRNIKEDNGELVYNDSINGVVIDWDGEFHDEKKENIFDTENEIDVLLMHNILPIFISCKNGVVTSEELFKLNTVAERFGGKYSKKILIATALKCMKDKG